MGFSIKFNWVLQVTPPANLTLDTIHAFRKNGNRAFPIDTPIDLIDSERNAIAKIKILSFTNSEMETAGEFKIIKIYTGNEKEILTNYWKENQ